jgi:hypothetical protein
MRAAPTPSATVSSSRWSESVPSNDWPGTPSGIRRARDGLRTIVDERAAGWSPKRVHVELGHADPAFTLRVYGHLWPDEIETGRNQLDTAIA